jgi:hypothetical protein
LANVRLLPPNNVQYQTLTVSGRTYKAAPGAILDVPDFDAPGLMANGWIEVATVGTTAQRPAKPNLAQKYMDTSLGLIVVFDGSKWRNSITAAAV